ncbi:hypothetical protein TNCV_676881 [Trichonephila clavipes]|nr:hypothetical protein TNCV_676881 [Trichonephila clavipes]
MHNATVQQSLPAVSLNSNPTIVKLQAEAGFISKHNVVPFRCPCLRDPSLPPVIPDSGATRWVRSASSIRRFLLHPAMTDPHHSCLVSSNPLFNFSEG